MELLRKDFNPLSPCGERQVIVDNPEVFKTISIHSPRAGRDVKVRSAAPSDKFQSTLPVRGETQAIADTLLASVISIHSPRAGRDARKTLLYLQQFDFNPLSPCGERRDWWETDADNPPFQSTLPVRGETF